MHVFPEKAPFSGAKYCSMATFQIIEITSANHAFFLDENKVE